VSPREAEIQAQVDRLEAIVMGMIFDSSFCLPDKYSQAINAYLSTHRGWDLQKCGGSDNSEYGCGKEFEANSLLYINDPSCGQYVCLSCYDAAVEAAKKDKG